MSASIFILPDTGIPDIIVMDAELSVNVSEPAVVTRYPVEGKPSRGDHYRKENHSIVISGIVTNTPTIENFGVPPGMVGRGKYVQFDFEMPHWTEELEPTPGSLFRAGGDLIAAGVGAIGDAIFGATPPPKVTVLGFKAPFNRPLEVETILQKIQDLAIACTIVTETRTFPSMYLIGNDQSKTKPGHKQFDLAFENVRTVSTEIVDAPVPTEPRGAASASLGSQGKKPTTPEDAAKASKSAAASIVDFFKG